jgi:hypothetical protein
MWVLQFVQCNMLSGVMLWTLHPRVHSAYFSLSTLRLGIGQPWLLVPLASDVSGISKHQVLCRTDLLCCCDNLFSEIIRSHYLQSISILLCYLCLVFFIWHLLNVPYQNFARVSHQSHGLYNILTKIVYAFVQCLVRPAAKYCDISLPSNYVTLRIPFSRYLTLHHIPVQTSPQLQWYGKL